MTRTSLGPAAEMRTLGRLQALRFNGRMRRPLRWVLLIGVPALLVAGALWSLSAAAQPSLDARSGAVTLAMLVSGIVAFLSYDVLFGASDWRFLRQLGIDAGAILFERAIRLFFVALVAGVALAMPYAIGGQPGIDPVVIGVAAGLVSAGTAVLSLALAARSSVDPSAGRILGGGIRQWDPELARAAPLVYAPLIPFLAGTLYGGLVAGAAPGLATGLLGAASAALAAWLGARLFGDVASRFLPRVGEIAYTPPTSASDLRRPVGRGISIFLPRPAAAVWTRDATVVRRRFPWATRLAWPITIAAVAALARWGEFEATRVWVIFAVGLGLLAQSAAIVGLGMIERHGRRWVDRAAGVSLWHRLLGRSALALGLAAWMLIPVTFAWRWWSGAPGAWVWPTAGLGVGVLAAGAAAMTAGR